MSAPLRRVALPFLAAAVVTAVVAAHVRLRYSGNGNALFWNTPGSVSLVIQEDGSDDIDDGSHVTALRNAISAWNGVTGTSAALVEDASPVQQARTDWGADDVHLVLFDEDNSSGYFPGANGIVAITPITFFTTGEIIDADVLFNGKNFTFTTSGEALRFDVQDVATHEFGHFLGLDHSGCAGATMYPYVDSTIVLHRSLSVDDENGLQHAYPAGSFGQIQGAVTRATGGSVVKGAHVVARDADGRFAAGTLTNDFGTYVLRGLPAGNFTVYADPLDFPVSSANLGGGQTVQTDFETTTLGVVSVTAGGTASLGTKDVGDDVAVSLGRVADDYPLRAVQGATRTLLVRGSGLAAGSTLTASDPTVAITSVVWFGSSVQFDVTVPALAPTGHFDLTVTNALGEEDTLVAGVEVTPPDPTVTNVTPGTGSPGGGTLVTLTGTGFRTGARVVVGNAIYADGVAGGCTVVDENTITLTTKATIGGSHDVVVLDPSGVEGRAVDAFQVTIAPTLDTVFPPAGNASGGTTLNLTGSDFVAGATVSIDGVVQPSATVESPNLISLTTLGGVVGGPYVLTVENPGGLQASAAFTYTSVPDPILADVTPDSGPASGGTEVTLGGANFDAGTTVVFGADAKTGAGGVAATSTTLVNGSTLRATTPASQSVSQTVMVRDPMTGQAALLVGAFSFEGVSTGSGGGSGGGCGAVDPRGPTRPRDVLAGGGWFLLGLLVLLLRARRTRATAATAAV